MKYKEKGKVYLANNVYKLEITHWKIKRRGVNCYLRLWGNFNPKEREKKSNGIVIWSIIIGYVH